MLTVCLILFWCSLLVVLYAQVGYSGAVLLFGSLGRIRTRREGGPRESTPDELAPTVSLIIPAHNEEAVLKRKLENALSLDYPADRLEVIVASDGSSDGTVDIAESFESRGVRPLAFGRRRGKASVVNDAVAAATGEVLCLCDANVMFEPDSLRMLTERLKDPGIGAVTADVRIASHQSNFEHGESVYYRIERAIQLVESRIGSLMGVDGGLYVVRKELFRPLPPDTILDDFVISMNVIRQGRRVVYEPAAVAHENGTPRALQEFRRRVRVSAGGVQSLKRGDFPPLTRPVELWQFVSHKLLRWVGPLLLVLLLGSNVMLWQAGWFYRTLLLGQVAFYLVAAVGTASVRFRKSRIGGIPFYFVMSHVAMAVGIVKGVANRQRVTWVQADRREAALPDESPVPV